MHIRLIVVGKPSRKARAFVDDYLARIGHVWPIEIVPVAEERLRPGRGEADVLRREGGRILKKCPDGWPMVALDRTGTTMDSSTFAEWLRRREEEGTRGIAFIIGGPLGLDKTVTDASALRLSFGPMTFSHDLALVMLCEQLYRALTIIRGWPYHR